MTLDPAQSSNSNNVYQSGQNGNDNRTNQNNQPTEKLQPSNQNHTFKANVRNNANGPELSVPPIKKLTQFVKSNKLAKNTEKQNEKKAYSQDDKDLGLFECVRKDNAIWVKKWIDAGADVNRTIYKTSHWVDKIASPLEFKRTGWHHFRNYVSPQKSYSWCKSVETSTLIEAAEHGNAKVLNLILSRPEIDVNKAIAKDGQPPLCWAAENGHIEIVKLLLSHPEIDVNKTDKYNLTALWWATWNGRTDIAKLLLSHPDIDVNKADNYDETVLYEAARTGRIEIVKELLSHYDIDMNKANYWDKTPLSAAVCGGHVEIIKLLLSYLDIEVNKPDNYGETVLCKAARKGYAEIVKLLLSHPYIKMNEDVRKYLDRLIGNNDVDSIQEIVLNGCSNEVYEHLYFKAFYADNPQLLEIFKGRLNCLVSGYANTEALGGHNKAYGKTKVPEGLLKIVKNYLNPNLIERQT
ncbi:MAG: ankyrin repeat domain-containing protein [Desulfobacteraceae bacterium]|nr:ankyrin repeat domain-containing protein [Desulfobacteraceae bacterium]